MSNAKKRHGCLSAFLIFLLAGNAAAAFTYLFFSEYVRGTLPQSPAWTVPVLGLLSICNCVFAAALFFMKKWGFLGFVFSSIAALMINLVWLDIGFWRSLSGLIGVVVLYGVLHIGKENQGWRQLE